MRGRSPTLPRSSHSGGFPQLIYSRNIRKNHPVKLLIYSRNISTDTPPTVSLTLRFFVKNVCNWEHDNSPQNTLIPTSISEKAPFHVACSVFLRYIPRITRRLKIPAPVARDPCDAPTPPVRRRGAAAAHSLSRRDGVWPQPARRPCDAAGRPLLTL